MRDAQDCSRAGQRCSLMYDKSLVYASKPTQRHWKGVKRILSFVKTAYHHRVSIRQKGEHILMHSCMPIDRVPVFVILTPHILMRDSLAIREHSQYVDNYIKAFNIP